MRLRRLGSSRAALKLTSRPKSAMRLIESEAASQVGELVGVSPRAFGMGCHIDGNGQCHNGPHRLQSGWSVGRGNDGRVALYRHRGMRVSGNDRNVRSWTFETCRMRRAMSEFEGKAENICSD